MAQITHEFRTAALRRGLIAKPTKAKVSDLSLRHAAAIEMANMGFIVDPASLDGMGLTDLEQMLGSARVIVGADRDMIPVYAGFPKQVAELDTMTLLFEQILHYWTAGAYLPNHPTLAREGLPIADMVRNARMVTVANAAEVARLAITSLMADPIALSPEEVSFLQASLKLQMPTLDELAGHVKKCRHGENLQHLLRLAVAEGSYSANDVMAVAIPGADNADQVLRIVLGLAASPSKAVWTANAERAVGNLSDRHARAIRMARLPRPLRRQIVAALGDKSAGYKADGLVARKNLWRRVLTAVHPYDFKLTDAEKRAVDIIHSNVPYRTLNSSIEQSLAEGKPKAAIKLLAKYQPGNLLTRLVAIARIIDSSKTADKLVEAVTSVGSQAKLTTLISAYNGVLSANENRARVTRVAGQNNTMRAPAAPIKESYKVRLEAALLEAISLKLKDKAAPTSVVGIASDVALPLVKRDASVSDQIRDRGERFAVAGEGDVFRIFGHWNNNQDGSGYMDIGVAVLDDKFEILSNATWDSWAGVRSWATYSGDKLVHPGDSAAEYFDVNLEKLSAKIATARYLALTVQSYSGWPIVDVDFLAGAMFRSAADKGEVYDARTLATAFKPTTGATQAVPLAFDLKERTLIWLDTSNGSTASCVSTSADTTIGDLVYDEVGRKKLTYGMLANLWATAHGVATSDDAVDTELIMGLLA